MRSAPCSPAVCSSGKNAKSTRLAGCRVPVQRDRKSTRSELQSPMYLVCRLLLEKKNVRLLLHADKLGQRVADRPDLAPRVIGPYLLGVDRLLAPLTRDEHQVVGG